MNVLADSLRAASVQTSDGSWSKLADEPYRYDLYCLLRWLDARGQHATPLGRGGHLGEEFVRLGQEPSMAFAPSMLASAQPELQWPYLKVSIFGFGLFGPNGPLPLHLTEFARDRIRNHGDSTLSAFADIFHHRLILLFYRAWADAQPTASLDRPDSARFDRHVAALIHLGLPSQRHRDSVPDHARYYFAGHQARLSRNPEGLLNMLRGHLGIGAQMREFMPQWIRIERAQQTRLGTIGRGHALGCGALLGIAVRDVQSSFRLVLGPLDWSQYQRLFPATADSRLVVDWVRHYLGVELHWDMQLLLRAEDARGIRLGSDTRLNWGSWLGQRHAVSDADELVYPPEAWIDPRRQALLATLTNHELDHHP